MFSRYWGGATPYLWHICVAGNASADGYPIIFSLDGINPEPEEDSQRNALIYIASLPT